MKRRLISVICLVAAIICAVLAVNGYRKEKNAGSSYDELRDAVKVVSAEVKAARLLGVRETELHTAQIVAAPETESAETGSSGSSEADPSDPGETETNPIDFEKLQEIAPDAYAWITVPGTQIDYPVVQHPTDNTFYLNHNPKGDYEFAGAIFTEDYNAKDFQDPNTVIYGHNMNNGSMFEELHKFEDKVFFDEHPEFVIYTPDEVLHYEIFAAYTYDNRHLLKEFDFEDSEVFRLYLQDILRMKSMGANIRREAEVHADDRIVTLSTCNGINEQRYLVQGVLLSNRNTEERR